MHTTHTIAQVLAEEDSRLAHPACLEIGMYPGKSAESNK